MSSKHTPGPWVVLPEEVGRDYIRVRGTQLGMRYKIANVHNSMPSFEFESEETSANACLIAAAPELLDAWTMGVELNVPDFLDWMADRLEHVHGENRLYDYMHHLRNIAKTGRAAIAKVTGK